MNADLERNLKSTYNHGRVVAAEISNVLTWGDQILDGAAWLDRRRHTLSGGDEVLDRLLFHVEVSTVDNALTVAHRASLGY